MFFIVPAENGVPNINHKVDAAVSIDEDTCLAYIRNPSCVGEDWIEVEESDELIEQTGIKDLIKQYRPKTLQEQIRELKQQNEQLQQDNLLLMLALTDIYEKIGGDK